MSDKVINPYQIYTAEEAAKLLNVDKRTLYRNFEEGTIQARELGRGWKVLGENLLTFMGSPTISTMQMAYLQNIDDIPPIPRVRQGGAVTQEESENMKPINNKAAGAAVEK